MLHLLNTTRISSFLSATQIYNCLLGYFLHFTAESHSKKVLLQGQECSTLLWEALCSINNKYELLWTRSYKTSLQNHRLRPNLNLSLYYVLPSAGEWLSWVSGGPAARGIVRWRWMEESVQVLWGRIIWGGYLAFEGSWFTGLQFHGGSLWCVKGFAATFQSQHMGTDIMHLCLMPGSGKGYVLTLDLCWNSAIRHASPNQELWLLAHLFIMQVKCGGCSVHESNQAICWCK